MFAESLVALRKLCVYAWKSRIIYQFENFASYLEHLSLCSAFSTTKHTWETWNHRANTLKGTFDCRLTTVGARSIYITLRELWNSLPAPLRQIESLSLYRLCNIPGFSVANTGLWISSHSDSTSEADSTAFSASSSESLKSVSGGFCFCTEELPCSVIRKNRFVWFSSDWFYRLHPLIGYKSSSCKSDKEL